MARQYRSYADFEREELSKGDGFLQSLDDFHRTLPEEDPADLFDKVDEDDKKKRDKPLTRARPRR